MLNILITFIIRAVAFAVTGCILGASLGISGFKEEISLTTAIIIWIIGALYSLSKLDQAYSFRFANNTEDKIIEIIDGKNKQKIENEMLRVKHLLDVGVLTKDEYNTKMQSLKDKYL